MAALGARFVAFATMLLVALALTQGTSSSAVLASVIAVALASACAVRNAGWIHVSREVTVGERARAHRHSLTRMPAPQHPDTAGRPRTRAPSMVVPAT